MTSRPEGDKSLRALLFVFIVATSTAASIIAIAFASAGSYTVANAKTMAVETPTAQNDADELPARQTLDKPRSDFTGYIDQLLADAQYRKHS